MGFDRFYHFDARAGYAPFSDPQALTPQGTVTARRTVTLAEDGEYYIQFLPQKGTSVELISPDSRYALLLHGEEENERIIPLKKGENEITVTLKNTTDGEIEAGTQYRLFHLSGGRVDSRGSILRDGYLPTENISFSTPLPKHRNHVAPKDEPVPQGMRASVGVEFRSYGRFGYTKGDGVLDYSMPAFGILTRPFVTGHPSYHRETMWHLSLLPDGECETGTNMKIYETPENESVECDWTHARWERRLESGKYISFDYSTISPALLVETNLNYLSLSRLSAIGSYSRISIPIDSRLVTRAAEGGTLYDRDRDGELSRGYVLFTHNGAFPEVPLLLAFKHRPERITRTDDEIRIEFSKEAGWAMLGFPYGIELLKTEELTEEWYARAAEKAANYHELILARPTVCREYFSASAESVTVMNKYEYRIFEDELNSPHRIYAPIPPTVTLAAERVEAIRPDDSVSLGIPTKYGMLRAVPDSTSSGYTLPVPEYKPIIPFSDTKCDELGKLLHSDFDEYLEYHSDLDYKVNPGAFSFIFQYSIVALLTAYLERDDLDKLKEAMRTGLKIVSSYDYRYRGPKNRRCHTWYERTEPYTGISHLMNYLHVTGISSYEHCDRETIEHSAITFIENDWGNAMSLYGVYLAALVTGEWETVEESWELYKRAFDYYLVGMDWACLTTGYCENGVSWNDGTNYGGYLGFLNMAEFLGKSEDADLARYAYAKLVALRTALFIATDIYFPDYFGTEPWLTTKFFHEETDGYRSFTSYLADRTSHGYRNESLYNLTTEGHYREAFAMYESLLPKETLRLVECAEASCPDTLDARRVIYHSPKPFELGEQEAFTYLALSIMTGRYSDEKMHALIDRARENSRISRGLLGSNLSGRRVPTEWTYAMLLAELYSRGEPRLAEWRGIEITEARYPSVTVRLTEDKENVHYLAVTSPTEPEITVNGRPAKFTELRRGLWRTEIASI